MKAAYRLALVCAATATLVGTAHAQDIARADALLEEGNKLGADGKYEEAIAKFREADALVKKPVHACNMGLAYVRLSLWAPAHYYLNRCKTTWSEGTLPSWVDRRTGEAEKALSKGNFTKVTVSVTPDNAAVTVAPFPGEPVASKTLWLPFGTHTISATAGGHEPSSQQLILANRDDRAVAIALSVAKPVSTDTPDPGPDQTDDSAGALQTEMPAAESSKSRKWLYAGIGTGVATVGFVALGFHFRAQATEARDYIESWTTNTDGQIVDEDGSELTVDDYTYEQGEINSNNIDMGITWTGAAITAGLTTWFLIKHLKQGGDEERPIVSAGVTPDGGQVSAGWSF